MKDDLKKFIPALVVLIAFVRFFIVPNLFSEAVLEQPIAETSEAPTIAQVNPFLSLNLEEESAQVLDLLTGEVLFEKDSHVQLPLASLTKLMTVLIALEEVEPIELVAIGTHSIQQEGSNGLVIGERWKLRDLVDFTLLSSSNDGAHALASAAASTLGTEDIISLMNTKATGLGLEQTYFINETGLDESEATLAGAYGSASDVSKMVSYILKSEPQALEATQNESLSITSLDQRVHTANNTNTAVHNIPWLVASKTGFTELAGGNLVVAFDAGLMHPVIVTVLGSSAEGRFSDVESLIETTFEYLESK